MNTTLQVVGLEKASISTSGEAKARRDELLARTAGVTTITSADESQAAASLLRDVSDLTRQIEADRKAVKAPIVALGKRIDAVADEIVGELNEEKTRISRAVGAYEAEQAEKRRRIEEEARRKEAEAARERDRQLREAEEKARSEKALAKKAEKIDDKFVATAAAIRTEASTTIAKEAPKAAGTALRQVWKFEVEDAATLYQHHPECVEITPIRAVILAKLNAGQEVAGIRAWKEALVSIR